MSIIQKRTSVEPAECSGQRKDSALRRREAHFYVLEEDGRLRGRGREIGRAARAQRRQVYVRDPIEAGPPSHVHLSESGQQAAQSLVGDRRR